MTKDLIIDGNNMLFRASFVPIAPVMFNGQNVAATQHFMRMVVKMARTYTPNRVYIAWDKKHNPDYTTFFRRTLIEDQYKGNRDPEKSAHIFENLDVIDEVCRVMGIRTIHPFDLEADDAIGWLARNHCESCVIVTSDSDLWQLITPTVSVHDANKKKLLTPQNFHEVCEVSVQQYPLYKSIIGDTSDNIPGVNGYGPKKTLKLIQSGDLSALTEDQHKIINRNLQIVDLNNAQAHHPRDFEYFAEQAAKFAEIKFDRAALQRVCNENGLIDFGSPRNISVLSDLFGEEDKMAALMSMF